MLNNRYNDEYKFETDVFTKQNEVTAACPSKVLAHYWSLTVVGEDGSIWGRGWKIQGDNEESRWRKLEIPSDCKKVKKVVVGKYCRAVLDEAGQIFFQGRPKNYMFNKRNEGTENLQKFIKIEEDEVFPGHDKTDKFVDIALGKKFVIVLTEKGKIYGSSYYLYRYLEERVRKNE